MNGVRERDRFLKHLIQGATIMRIVVSIVTRNSQCDKRE